jgi:hypothetical protein
MRPLTPRKKIVRAGTLSKNFQKKISVHKKFFWLYGKPARDSIGL